MEDKKNTAGDNEKSSTSPKKDKNKYLNEISDMSFSSLVDYAIRKILIPYGKKAVLEILDAYFYSKATGPTITGPSEQKTDYNKAFLSSSTSVSTSLVAKSDVRNRSVYAYEEMTFERHEKASALLEALKATLKKYMVVKVSDFYEFLDMEVAPNDCNFGWTNLDEADIVVARDGFGYRLSLPRAKYLK